MNYNDLFIETKLPQPFTNEELHSYFEKMYAGDQTARTEIINHNIRLVISEVSRNYAHTLYDKQELVSIGLIGLIKSVDTFDISKEIQFTTYSTKCINNEILIFIAKAKKYINDDSLDRPLKTYNNKDELRIEDVLYDEDSELISDYEIKERYRVVRQVVGEIPGRDREIVQKYFGFTNGKPMTQLDIAKSLGIAQPYVSQVIRKGLIKISLQLLQKGIIEVDDIHNENKIFIKNMLLKLK